MNGLKAAAKQRKRGTLWATLNMSLIAMLSLAFLLV
jgi:hypothetical protein